MMMIIESVVKYGFIFSIGSALTVGGDTCAYCISHLSGGPKVWQSQRHPAVEPTDVQLSDLAVSTEKAVDVAPGFNLSSPQFPAHTTITCMRPPQK